MSEELLFLIILILAGIYLISRYNKLPHPLITFLSVFAIMCIIYVIPYILMVITSLFERFI
ncbi:MAG: hypothetical protein ACO1OT_12125 [Heyndrickxia sp.]